MDSPGRRELHCPRELQALSSLAWDPQGSRGTQTSLGNERTEPKLGFWEGSRLCGGYLEVKFYKATKKSILIDLQCEQILSNGLNEQENFLFLLPAGFKLDLPFLTASSKSLCLG